MKNDSGLWIGGIIGFALGVFIMISIAMSSPNWVTYETYALKACSKDLQICKRIAYTNNVEQCLGATIIASYAVTDTDLKNIICVKEKPIND